MTIPGNFLMDNEYMNPKKPIYTLSQIKAAFWAAFHESGEKWFSNLGSAEENEKYTQDNWAPFLEELEGK